VCRIVLPIVVMTPWCVTERRENAQADVAQAGRDCNVTWVGFLMYYLGIILITFLICRYLPNDVKLWVKFKDYVYQKGLVRWIYVWSLYSTQMK
jgi:hypothetical protein